VDALAEKFPNISGYAYCGNNPIMFVDPDGNFSIPIHWRIIDNAFKQSGLSNGFFNSFRYDVRLGATIEADILGYAFDFHFDARQNYSEIQSTWNNLIFNIKKGINNLGSVNRAIGGNDAILFGRMLHTVQDFYSHSNYVELYMEYYQGANNGVLPTSVPTYDEGIKNADFNSLLKDKLRTGDFNLIDNEIFNPKGKSAQLPTSHNKMNKDKADTYAGKLAEKVATEHTVKIMRQAKKEAE
jgi:hypothetical protein